MLIDFIEILPSAFFIYNWNLPFLPDVDVELADLHNIQNQIYRTPAAFQQEFDATLPPKLTKSFQKYTFQFPIDETEPELYTLKENSKLNFI